MCKPPNYALHPTLDAARHALREIPAMPNRWEINCPENDGQLLWKNLSVPTSVGETITIGLRYRAQDQARGGGLGPPFGQNFAMTVVHP